MKPLEMKKVLSAIEGIIPHLREDTEYSPDRIASRCCRFLGEDVKGRQIKEVLDALDAEPIGRYWTGTELRDVLDCGLLDAVRQDCEAKGEGLVNDYRKKFLTNG